MQPDSGSAARKPGENAEGHLGGSLEQHRMLLESSSECTLLARTGGAIYAANSAACRLLRRSEQEIIAAGCQGISGASNLCLLDAARECARTGVFQGEGVIRRNDGIEVPVEIRCVVVADDISKSHVSMVLREVGGPRRAVDALRKSEGMLARAQQLANLGSWEWDVATGELLWSDQAYRMLGRQPGEFHPTYERFLAILHPDDRPRLEAAVARALEGAQYRIEFRVVLPDSSVRHIYSQSDTDYDASGKPVRMVGTALDITERKEAQEALRDSETRLRLAVEATGLGTFDFYPKTGKLVWSEITKSHFGMAPETEIDHDMFLGAIHPEDRERIRQTGLALALPGSDGQLAAEYRTIGVEDGKERCIAARGRMLFDAEGRATRMIGTTFDISERRRLEEQLRQRAEELQTLMDVAPVALMVARDAECSVVIGNRAASAMSETREGDNLSLPTEGISANRCRFFRDGVEITTEEMPLRIAAARGIEVRDWELDVLLPSGKRKSIWGQASPLRDAAGQVRGAIAAFQDVTAGKERTEAALRESEERFRETADAAPVIIWYGDTEKRITFFNKQITVFTGVPVEQMLGHAWAQVIHPDDLEAARAVYYKAVDEHTSYQIEYRARRADGEYRNMLGTTNPRYIGDVYAGQVGTVLDITELKRRQEESLSRQKLESLGTLAGGIAHDFNNLLGGILSQTELALAELAEGGSAQTEMENIRAVAIRGAEIVRQLMVYAGQEADAFELVDVSRLVEQTIQLLKVVVSKHAALRPRLAADVPAVLANPATLRQILINLVTNASEAIGELDGVIHVTTDRVTREADLPAAAGSLPPGDYLQLEVSDTGCGMTLETQTRVFDPFFTTKSQGRGLGLPVVHGIVRRLGGEITVRSRLRHGTTFRILLPGAGQAAAEPEAPAVPVAETHREPWGTLLIVEDEDTLRIAMSKILRREGLTVLEAADGSDALELLRNHREEVTGVLLDVTLPGTGSPEVLREAKRIRPDMRVILTSAYGEETVVKMFAGAGPHPFLRKPYRTADVLKLLLEPRA